MKYNIIYELSKDTKKNTNDKELFIKRYKLSN